ncbi:phosphotransferase enzyme family protein [Microbacterium sp. SORGH_AS_0888]|uniref:phosphotransferase enzyme family protein n=1 Tax=Microbacterium sp. SORGH_AS_0888 TaxID=3041791 RepID=UPI002780DCE5|nr:phosphotransferase [Microbacterium sp. SORGH_AS_0888]MDQ1128346.1 Ser/Thr protein kinase RdoA (MazF antagonist) [Microbacterium sp. SORGH_AS_0888]
MIGSEDEYTRFARAALDRYGFGAHAQLTLLSLSENGTFLARDQDGAAILRVHRPGYHDRRAIESELTWMERVREDCGIATPHLVPAADGSRVVTVVLDDQVRHVDAVTVVAGRTGEEAVGGVPLAELGRISAHLHRHAESWRPPEGFTRFRWDFAHCLGDAPRWGRWQDAPGIRGRDHGILATAVDTLRAALEEYGTSPARFGLVHADLRMSNVMVGTSGEITVIDFDDCGYGWLLSDLSSIVSWREHEHDEAHAAITQWLRGYLPHRELTDEDLAMIPAFVMMRRLMLTAWLGTHPDSPPARRLGGSYARGTVDLADRYLRDRRWLRYTLSDLRSAVTT